MWRNSKVLWGCFELGPIQVVFSVYLYIGIPICISWSMASGFATYFIFFVFCSLFLIAGSAVTCNWIISSFCLIFGSQSPSLGRRLTMTIVIILVWGWGLLSVCFSLGWFWLLIIRAVRFLNKWFVLLVMTFILFCNSLDRSGLGRKFYDLCG